MAAIRSSLLALLLLAACGSGAPEAVPAQEAPTAAACMQRAFEGTAFTVCRYDRRHDEVALYLDGPRGPLRSFAALETAVGPRLQRLRFAMNGGMYDEEGRPIGLHVEDGRERRAINRRRGPGNFHMLPNGVFTVAPDGRVAVVPSDRYRPASRPRWATQSGPMLVVDGRLHPAIQDNGPSLHIRNGVGVDSEDTAWLVISDEAVSFGRLARFFRDSLNCRNALYLDGSVSSLWDRPGGRRDPRADLGPLIAVFEHERRE